jgi:hypothetical protein
VRGSRLGGAHRTAEPSFTRVRVACST